MFSAKILSSKNISRSLPPSIIFAQSKFTESLFVRKIQKKNAFLKNSQQGTNVGLNEGTKSNFYMCNCKSVVLGMFHILFDFENGKIILVCFDVTLKYTTGDVNQKVGMV